MITPEMWDNASVVRRLLYDCIEKSGGSYLVTLEELNALLWEEKKDLYLEFEPILDTINIFVKKEGDNEPETNKPEKEPE